jgi:hypothetical protein
LAGETEVLGENLPRRHFVHHKSHLLDSGLRGGKPATNRFSYGAALSNEYVAVDVMAIGRRNGSIYGEDLRQFHYCLNYGTANAAYSGVTEVSEKPGSSMFRV